MMALDKPYPHFFLVGAARSGTTALHAYLSAHPDIFMPRKELHYFGTDLPRRPGADLTLDQYLAHFDDAHESQLIGDTAVMYLYSKTAAHDIHDHNPDARILMTLRNPVDAIYAFYFQQVFQGREDIYDFAAALAAEGNRREGRRIPRRSAFLPEQLFYVDRYRYAEQVERYLQLFPREQIHVFPYDDFAADPAGTYKGILEFLGVGSTFQPPLDRVNASRRIRSKRLLELRFSPPGWVHSIADHSPGIARKLVKQGLFAAAVETGPRPPMPRDAERGLYKELQDDIERLGELIGRDLRMWRPRSPE